MDEEHFKTFTSGIIKKLLQDNFQVIIFTHSDQFAREISYNYWNHDQLRHNACPNIKGKKVVKLKKATVVCLKD